MIAAAIVGCVGLILLASGISAARANAGFMRRAQRAQGTIVDLQAGSTQSSTGGTVPGESLGGTTIPAAGGGGLVYRPTVTFTTSDGREVTAESPIGTDPPPGRVGDTVTVLDDPLDPDRMRLDTVLGRGGAFAYAGVGAGAVLVAVAILVAVLTA